MAKIILDGCKINESTASGHINTERYIQVGTGGGECNGWDIFGNCISTSPTYPTKDWVGGYSINAKINGTVKSEITNVVIEGKKPIVKDSKTTESDTYTVGFEERYASGQHTNVTTGSITGGNSSNVYINGKLVSITGSTVKTHANTNTTIGNDKVSSTVTIGG